MEQQLNNGASPQPDDETIVRYLLNDLPKSEQAEFEESYCSDQRLFERARSVEDELIEDYVNGELSGRELLQFKQHFLATPARRERVAFARDLRRAMALDSVEEESDFADAEPEAPAPVIRPEPVSWWDSWRDLWRGRALAFGVAMATVLLVTLGGVWHFVSIERLRQQSRDQLNQAQSAQAALEQQKQATVKQRERSDQLAEGLEQERKRLESLNTEVARQRERGDKLARERKQHEALMAEDAESSTTRPEKLYVSADKQGDAQINSREPHKITIQPGKKSILLEIIILDRDVDQIHRGSLKHVSSGQVIWNEQKFEPLRKDDKRVIVWLAANKFKIKDLYVLKLQVKKEEGSREVDYLLQVEKK
jgi:hypothetical protein